MSRFSIHPRIGVARVGNSASSFYLGPEDVGGLPLECSDNGAPIEQNGQPLRVSQFRDKAGAIRRQAARFKIFKTAADGSKTEVVAGQAGIKSIQWTVHLANKKPIWYTFSELTGDLEFGEWNSYEAQHVPRNNGDVTDPADRKKLIIDPGPRTVSKPGDRTEISRYNAPEGYADFSFPPDSLNPPINSLGSLLVDPQGRLLVLGGYGHSAGTSTLSNFRGASGWWDDVSDGYVLATLVMDDGQRVDLEPAWVIVGSPKFAPELVNIVTLDDTLFDVSVRHLKYKPDLYDLSRWPSPGPAYNPVAGFNPDYEPNFERDLLPLFERPDTYRWVAHVPSMTAFTRPSFDVRDKSEANRARRERYFSLFRIPVPAEHYAHVNIENGPNCLLHAKEGIPLMPLNSGDNSVTNDLIYKFMTLTPTQYFFLQQWAKGKFQLGAPAPDVCEDTIDLDHQVLANLVGAPFSPGIETTWIVRNPKLYSRPFNVAIAHWQGSNAALVSYYTQHGLSLDSDPQNGDATEPGDLTKRMAIPWQADFFDCTVQTPNAFNPEINQSPADDGVQVPPSFYVYWWPPQSPMHVVAGSFNAGDQVLDGYVSAQPGMLTGSNGINVNVQSQNGFAITAAGQPVSYSRGVNSFGQMVAAWADLGFVLNAGTADYPFFTEQQRNTVFLAQGAGLGSK